MFRNKLKLFIIISAFSSVTFTAGWALGIRGAGIKIGEQIVRYKIINREVEKEVDFNLFWQVWDLVHEKYLDGKNIDVHGLVYGAIRGMLQAIGDPYTAFLDPEQNKSMHDSLGGRYEGIGAELGMREEGLIIVAPLEGSPAENAGVKALDRIVKIEDENTSGITIAEAVSIIRGPAGEPVRLTLSRESVDEPFEVTIIRAQITLKSVSWEYKEGDIAYIRLSRFGERTNADWEKVVSEISNSSPKIKAVVLDVRGNPGGYLNSSVYLATEFVKFGTPVVIEEFGDGRRIVLKATRYGKFLSVPLVVLINEGSASASEILAAALKEQRGALLVGKKSFGKGTVQDAQDLTGGSGVHITIAKWLTSKGVWIDKKGLEVDYVVEISEEAERQSEDPQLDKALEVARELLFRSER